MLSCTTDLRPQPETYRAVIDDVISSVKVDFEEYGMEEDVLQNLQAKWEAKLLETRVADFAQTGADSPHLQRAKAELHSPPTGPSHHQPDMYPFSRPGVPQQGAGGPGSMANIYRNGGVQQQEVRVKPEPRYDGEDDPLRLRGGAAEDGNKPEPNAAGLLPGDDVIDSDLDDSDDENRGDVEAEDEDDVDIVFCVYDKVQRVKNKWKTVFKDGMIHLNGKDYLFAKCNGEFEW
ncbi:hypothetical protein B9479_000908 [Cryptococcus floricola]|uniref:Transcription initiation factor IIA large subunit n=1 Tax=Cryptococcus floricola TaxID=2591691 RepID=A0A5D3B5V0_9TREE|nr:hypothetical protein B9479_000908 [Cryptococcus floricola]